MKSHQIGPKPTGGFSNYELFPLAGNCFVLSSEVFFVQLSNAYENTCQSSFRGYFLLSAVDYNLRGMKNYLRKCFSMQVSWVLFGDSAIIITHENTCQSGFRGYSSAILQYNLPTKTSINTAFRGIQLCLLTIFDRHSGKSGIQRKSRLSPFTGTALSYADLVNEHSSFTVAAFAVCRRIKRGTFMQA